MRWRAAMSTNCAKRVKAAAVLGPQLIVEENPHHIEPVQPRPAELGVDALRVEGVGLKHLELVDGV